MTEIVKGTRAYYITRVQPILRAIPGADANVVGRLMNKICDEVADQVANPTYPTPVKTRDHVYSMVRLKNQGDAALVDFMVANRTPVKQVITLMLQDMQAA